MGARVVVSARKADELEAAVEQLVPRHRLRQLDRRRCVGTSRRSHAWREESIARLGHVDILVNNAGATWGAPAEEHPPEAWDKVMNLNIRARVPADAGDRARLDDPAALTAA